MALRRDGAEEIAGDFFRLRFFGGCSGQGARPPGAGQPGPPPEPQRRDANTDRPHLKPHRTPPWTHGGGGAPSHTNQTSNQTSRRSLVSWPRLPRFGHFPFHFPFRGEKGSGPHGWRNNTKGRGLSVKRLGGEAGPFFLSRPQARIPADLATQGQRFHLAGEARSFSSASLKQKFQLTWPLRAKGSIWQVRLGHFPQPHLKQKFQPT